MKTKKRLRTIVRRLIAMLIAVVMCITSGDGMGRVYAQTVEVGRPDSSELVRYLTLSVKDVTTGEVIVENGTPTGNRVNENDDVKIMFEFLIGEMDTIEKDENGNYLTFSTEVNTSGGRLKETGSDYLPDTGNSNRDMGDWSLTSDGKLTVNINDKGADSATEQGNGYVFLKGTGKSIWVTWEGKLDFSGVEDAETGEGMIDVIVAGEKTAVPVNLDDNKVSVSKKITQKDGNDVYYDKKSGKYFVDYQINVKTDKGYAFIDSIDDEAGTTIGDDFYNLQISLKTAYGSVSKIEGATLADLNTAIRTDEELIITYSREVKPDFLNGSDKYYDSDGSRTNKAIVHGITNHGTKVSPESSPVIYSNASPGIGKEGKYEDGKINWTCYIEIPKDSGISVKTIEDEISHTITPNTAIDGNIGVAPSDIKNIANWNKVSDNPIRYEYSYSTDVSELLLEEKNIKAALIKNELNVVFKDQNGEEVTRYIAPVVEVNPGPGETIHTSKATVQKTFEEYNKFKQVSTKYRLLKWEITVTTPSEEDWNDLSYIDLVDDPETSQHHYLARRVELEDGTLLYSDSGFNRGQSSNTGYFTDEGKKYFDTSLAEADKTQYPFDINNGCLKLRLKKDNLSPEKDYTFVVYTRVTDDSKLSTRSFKNGVKVSTIYKDTLQVEEDKDSAESGVLKTTEKYGEATGKAGEVEYTVTFNLGAYAKNLRMQNRTLYPNDKIVFNDEIKNGYLEYVPDSAYLSCDMFQSEYYKIPYTEFTGNLEVSTDGGKTTFTYTMTDELMKLFDYTTGTFTYHGSQFNPILKINYLAKLTDEEARELTLSEEKENNYSNEVKVSYNGVVVGQDTEDIFLTANKVLDKQYVHQGAKLTYTVTVNPDAVKFNDDGSRLYAKDFAGADLRIIKNSIKVSDANGELESGPGKNQYDYRIEKDQNGDNIIKFNIPDGKALTITYSALIDVEGNIIKSTDRVANTFCLYKHEDVMEIDRVSNSIESGDFVQESGGSSARATVGLSKVWFNGEKYISLNDCKFELYECRVKDDIVLVGDRVSFSKDNNIYMADIDGTESDISISEEGVTLKELDYAKLYLLHETEAPNPLNKTDYYFIVSNDSGNDATLKISDEEYESKYKNVTDEDGNSLEIHKYKDSNAQFEIEDFVEFELDAKKTVKYTDGSEAPMGTYAFKIEEVDVDLANAEVIENGYSAIATNDEEGNIEFDPIRVNMTQDEEYYYYKVTEYTAELPDDVIGDDTYYIITMHVKRRNNGEFTHDLAYTKYERDGKDSVYSASYVNADDIKFKNVVESNDKGSLEISKSVYVDGNDRTNTYKDKAYSFTVQDKDKNYYDTDGTKTSDEKIISVYPGEVVTVSGLKPGKYTVKEITETVDGYTLTRTYTVDSSVNTKDVSKTSYTDAGVAVEIDDKESVTVAFKNDYVKDTGNLKITKKFINIDDNSSIDISKLTDAEKAKVIFEIEGPDSYDEIITLKDFSSDLTYTFENIPVGEYTITEDNQLTDTKEYTFVDYVVSYKDGESEIEPDFNKVNVTKNSTTEATVTNAYEKRMAELAVSKTFEGTVSEADKNNVLFEIYDNSNILIAGFTYEDMESGVKRLEVLPGTYTVKEVAKDISGTTISKSYKVESSDSEHNTSGVYTASGVTVTLANKEKAEVAFNNKYVRDSGKLEITKTFVNGDEKVDISSLTDEEKAAVKFTITGPDDYKTKTISLLDFDSDMKYLETGVPTGDYTVTETGADAVDIDGYTFSESVKVITKDGEVQTGNTAVVAKDETTRVAFTSRYEEEKTSLKITKSFVCGDENLDISSMSEEDKKNIKFTIKGPEKYGTKVVTLADFDENLTYVEKDIPVGEYTVTEAGADSVSFDGYTFSESVKNITEDGVVRFTSKYAEEEKTTSLKITKSFVCGDENLDISKLSEDDKKNIKFTITGPEKYGTKVVTLADFDENFTYVEKEIPAGDYTVTESGADKVGFDGYTFSESVKVVTEDGIVQFTSKYAEEEKTTSLKITKSFVCGDESLDISKLSEADKKNIKFTIKGPEKYGTKVVTLADFDENLTYVEKDIPVGEYIVTETGADKVGFDGYTFSESVKNITENGEVQFTSKYDEFKVKEERGTLKIAAYFNVEGDPYDISAISSTDKESVTFRIYGPESYGTEGTKDITLNDFVSGVYTEENVPAGLYYITELSCPVEIPEASFDEVSISLKGGEKVPYDGERLSDGEVLEFSVTNSYKKNIYVEGYGYLTIRNTVVVDNSATGAEADSNLSGRTYKITVKDADGNYVRNEVDSDGMAVLTTDKADAVIYLTDGEEITLGKLKLGTYTVEEDKVDAIAGGSDISGMTLEDRYVLEVTGIGSVNVTSGVATSTDATSTDASAAAKVEIVNTYVERKLEKAKTVARFTVVDEDGNPISGATVQVVDENGNVIVGPWTSTDGKYEVSGVLKADADKTYKLVVVEVPNGYQKADPVEFKVDEKKVGPDGTVFVEVSMALKKTETPQTDVKSGEQKSQPGADTGEQKIQPGVGTGEQKSQAGVKSDEQKPQTDVNAGKQKVLSDKTTDEPKKKDDKPETGDDFPIIPVTGLMFASLTGLYVVGKKKRSADK